MRIRKIETGNLMLDGGAMFGVVPKSLWSKVYPADENNLINLSMRCLMIEADGRLFLINAGLGDKLDEKFLKHYHLNGDDTLDRSLHAAGYKKDDITDVVFTHLHFDHCGGGTVCEKAGGELRTAFARATYHVSRIQWEWMLKPNRRERVSFLKENTAPLESSGQLHLFEDGYSPLPSLSFRLYHGHTGGMAVPFIRYDGLTLVYMTDFIPTMAHIPLSWICAYDTRPLLSLDEHERFLNEAVDNDYILVFEHDLYHECCRLERTPKGIRACKASTLEEVLKSHES